MLNFALTLKGFVPILKRPALSSVKARGRQKAKDKDKGKKARPRQSGSWKGQVRLMTARQSARSSLPSSRTDFFISQSPLSATERQQSLGALLKSNAKTSVVELGEENETFGARFFIWSDQR